MLGASAKRIGWAMDIARETRQGAGMEGDIPVSAYENLVVHDDGELAWKMASPAITSQARFMAMHGNDFITSDFAHEFGIYGPPSYRVDRISELAGLDVDRFILAGGPDLAMPQAEIAALARRFMAEVLPKFK